MIRIAVAGYGNIGKAALPAIEAAPDMELAGVVVRRPDVSIPGVKVAANLAELGKVDVAILTWPSRDIPEIAGEILRSGVSTVDSFDIHAQVAPVRARLNAAAKAGNAVSVLSAGWDPGSDSVIRALITACAPKGITHTNFGPGLSMGHSVAVRAIAGVRNAVSMTIPAGESRHRRMVYIELDGTRSFDDVSAAIKADAYFVHDETYVTEVESVDELTDVGHGVRITRKGVSSDAHNQLFSFDMRINNPALTAQVLVAAARAATRQKPGCYTMIELPLVDLLPGEREGWVAKLV